VNKYKLPEEALNRIRKRDKECVYCHGEMKKYDHVKGTPHDKATIEHLNTEKPWDNPSTVVICCGSCNSSRGKKELVDWFKGEYCIKKKINKNEVAEPVKNYLIRGSTI